MHLFSLSPFILQFASQLKSHLLSQQIYNLVPVRALILCLLIYLFHFFHLQLVSTTSCAKPQRLSVPWVGLVQREGWSESFH